MSADKTRIRRLPERSVDDRSEINSILDEAFVCHASYVVDERPVVIPTLYVRDGDRLLLHGSNTSGLARAARRGSPLCVAVTHLDGLVVARSGFHSSANYRSVVIHGVGRLLTGGEHSSSLDVIVEKLIPGRTDDIRSANESEKGQTSVIELTLGEVSAKVRTGGPNDDPADLESDAWAGVLPFALLPGEPIPADDLEPGIPIPEYLMAYRR